MVIICCDVHAMEALHRSYLGVARLFNLASKKHFVDERIDLVEVEQEVELAHVGEVLVQGL